MENWDPGHGYPTDRKIPRCFSQSELDTLADSTAVQIQLTFEFKSNLQSHESLPLCDMTFYKSSGSSENKVPNKDGADDYTYAVWELDGDASKEISAGGYGQIINMPLWLALDFHRLQKGRILSPFWLRKEYVLDLVKAQSRRGASIIPLHPYFFEIANILFKNCPDIFECLRDVQAAVDRLSHVRLNLLLSSLKVVIKEGAEIITLVSLVKSEMNFVRQSCQYLLNCTVKIDKFHNSVEIRKYMQEQEETREN
eukprot:Filipodium_phascolosomae@DN2458_c0_g1_i1.p1